MILSNIKILYLDKDIFKDVQEELFSKGYGLNIGWTDKCISQLYMTEENDIIYINMNILDRKYRMEIKLTDQDRGLNDSVNVYILNGKVLNIYVPLAMGTTQFGLKVEGSKYIDTIIINGMYRLDKKYLK